MAKAKKRKAKTKGAEFKRRSKAAKLGHKRRLATTVLPKRLRKEKLLLDNARIVVGKKPKKRPDGRHTAKKKKESLEAKVERLEEEIAYERSQRQALEETANFVHTRDPEFLREDWTLAVMPSRLRHRAETQGLRDALAKAVRKGKKAFDEIAHSIAEFYDVDVKEVYTLHLSP